MIEKIFTSIGTYVVGPILLGVLFLWVTKLGEWFNQKRKIKAVEQVHVKDIRIRDLLIQMRVKVLPDHLEASRAFIAMYHNGHYFVDGSDDLKKSRTHEVVGPGVSYEAETYQDIRVSLMLDEVKVLKDESKVVCVGDLDDGEFRRLLEAQGVQCVIRRPLTIHNNEIIGIVGIDFNEMVDPAHCDGCVRMADHFIRQIEQIIADARRHK